MSSGNTDNYNGDNDNYDVISLDDELTEAEDLTDHPLSPSHYITKVSTGFLLVNTLITILVNTQVSDTAKHFLPEQAGTTVDMMSSKVRIMIYYQ